MGRSVFSTWKSNTTTFSSTFPDLLYIVMLLAKVGEHVSMITRHISTEDLDVPGRTEFVHSHHEVFGAPGQTNLNKTICFKMCLFSNQWTWSYEYNQKLGRTKVWQWHTTDQNSYPKSQTSHTPNFGFEIRMGWRINTHLTYSWHVPWCVNWVDLQGQIVHHFICRLEFVYHWFWLFTVLVRTPSVTS